MVKLSRVRVGLNVKCKYPKHGRLNILCNRTGVIKRFGVGPNGPYIVLHNPADGTYRTLRRDRMIDAMVVS